MARPSEQAGRRLRSGCARLRAAVGRHRDRLLRGLAVAGLTLAVVAEFALGSRSLGPLLAIGVGGLAVAQLIEAA